VIRRYLRDEALLAALPGWVLARVLVGAGFVVALVASDELRPHNRPLQIHQGLFAWDAAFYRDLADYGYHHVAREGLRFFPLLPLASRALAVPLFGNVGVALLLLVNVAALVAGALLYRVALRETRDRAVATRAAWFLALLPPATVLVLGYAEALLLVFAIAFFLCIRSDRWWSAILFGVLAGLTRPVGMTLLVPAVIEGLRDRRHVPPHLPPMVAPVVGGGAYLAWVDREYGDWKLPLRLQNATGLRGGWANPLSTVWHATDSLIHGGSLGEGLHVPWIAVFAVLLVVAFRTLPSSYGWWSAVLLVSATTGHTLGSFERYGLGAFPLVLALAIALRRPLFERVGLVTSGAALSAFAALVFVGAFVP
jgi:hypothetical protein